MLTITGGRMDLASWLLTALAVMGLLASVAVLVGLARSGSRPVDAWLRSFAAHQGPVGRRGQWGRFFTLASWIRGAATGAVLLTGLMAAGLAFAGLSPANLPVSMVRVECSPRSWD
ncbi:hypothetical protein [uncultured Aeromicrobium sp.]|uniref:hypothetical protein n=1 Tax=uncultured Aeromicrobium sp. TaxID=337820 RepID=UPI0025FEFBB9|nr:hypothetical protein [uncultured Aeromicrobium sp.]